MEGFDSSHDSGGEVSGENNFDAGETNENESEFETDFDDESLPDLSSWNDVEFEIDLDDGSSTDISEAKGFEEVTTLSEIEDEKVSDENSMEKTDELNVSKSIEVKIGEESEDEKSEYPSTYKERIDRTPSENSERGTWTSERGESTYIPSDPEMKETLEKYGLEGIEYKDGIPDFSQCSSSTVEIDNMSENRYGNFAQCDEKCVEQWNQEGKDGKTDWTARDVKQWRGTNGYSWHERNDMKTCDLVPTEINDYFGHLGGVSECKKCTATQNDGGDFDE